MISEGPITKSSAGNWRARSVVTAIVFVGIVLSGRLVHLQWIDRENFAKKADRQRSYVEPIPARPGEIVDRHGRLLATTVNAHSLFVIPNRIAKPRQIVPRLAAALDLNADRLLERILKHQHKQFLWIKRRLSDEEAETVRKLDLPTAIWGFREEYLRRYPQGRLAAHILGLRDIDGNGRGGLEQSLDAVLRGQDGRRILVRDARGRVIDIHSEIDEAPQHGRTVVLTIDTVIQLFAERELDKVISQWKAKSACVIILDPQTCEILAMASRPTFDPNHPVDVADDAWKNTNVSAIYEPGSTFKPIVVAWAIDKGAIKRDDRFYCENGQYHVGQRVLHDQRSHGWLSVSEILVNSSNIGMAKIGERLTNEALYHAATAFGFGRKTGCGLPGELAGLVRPLKSWDRYSTGSVPMGQEISVTPLQLITAHAVLANGGKLMTPRLVLTHTAAFPIPSQVTSATEFHDNAQATLVSRTIEPETARWIVEGPLVGVVQRGTGKKARLEDYAVFGKTGTAQKIDPATGRYSSQLHVSSFLCGAPADNPRVLVLVLVDEPNADTHLGSTVAAPAAARLLRKTLIHLRVPTRLARRREGVSRR
jgi:cell division protein FtsI/penicillin-binding protein 2